MSMNLTQGSLTSAVARIYTFVLKIRARYNSRLRRAQSERDRLAVGEGLGFRVEGVGFRVLFAHAALSLNLQSVHSRTMFQAGKGR